MSEAEAKTKWCPLARVSAANSACEGNHARNRDTDGDWDGMECIASACMAWREIRTYRGDTNEDDISGYCGLAGRP